MSARGAAVWPLAWLCMAIMLVGACSRTSEAPQSSAAPQRAAAPTVPAVGEDAVVARIGDRTITAAEVDVPLQLALHDLDMQKYRLRRQALEAEILRTLEDRPPSERVAEITLEPPNPPRVSVAADSARTRPTGDAPVTVLAFCNLESPHCARLQVTLAQVLPLFPGVVRYAERDLPLEFHRHAGKAAEAARCALDQGNYWRFHDVILAGADAPDRTALDRAARATDLDMQSFAKCLDEGKHAGAVAADGAMAKALGLSVVPAVFVNGLHASPDVRPADLVWLIERELATLGIASPRSVAAETHSTSPFELQGVLVSPHAGQGLALLSPSVAPERLGAYREGDAIATGLVVRRITGGGIELLRDGQVERLGFGTQPVPPSAAESPAQTAAVQRPHRAVPVTLDRDRVLVLLADRIALAQALQPAPMPVDGHRLLKLQSVAPGSLYELLGLESGDVILMVNEQPLTEAFNPLWDALEKEDEVRLRVIRRGGLAQHFTYRFGD